MRTLLAAAVVIAACAHPRPISVRYGRTELGRTGLRASIDLEVTRKCEATLTELGRLPRKGALERADCDELFAAAARAALGRTPNCTSPQPFAAGVAVRLSDGTTLYGCWDDPFSAEVAKLAERYAPALRRIAPPDGVCDPVDCRSGDPSAMEIDGTLSKGMDGCTEETSRECRRRADATCVWVQQHTGHCAVP